MPNKKSMTSVKSIGWSKETGLVIQFNEYFLYPSCFDCSRPLTICSECGHEIEHDKDPCLDCKDKTEVLIKPVPMRYNMPEEQYNKMVKNSPDFIHARMSNK